MNNDEPVIPDPPSFESQYCSYGDCGYVECEKSFLFAKLGAAEAKVAEQATVIEQLTKGIKQYKDVRDRFGEYSANEILFPESDAALSK